MKKKFTVLSAMALVAFAFVFLFTAQAVASSDLRLELGPGVLERLLPSAGGGFYMEEGVYEDNQGKHIAGILRFGVPEYPEGLRPLADSTGRIVVLVDPYQEFENDRVFIEFFTSRGEILFICRTLIPTPR